MIRTIKKTLDLPIMYKMAQFLLAPGSEYFINKKIKEMVTQYSIDGLVADIGCGPQSWLWAAGLYPTGIDLSYTYSLSYRQKSDKIVVGSSRQLPFKHKVFSSCWSVGVFHHLTDEEVAASLQEMARVTKDDGHIIIFDAVLPKEQVLRPLAYLIRKNDRGEYMRTEEQLDNIFSGYTLKEKERFTYALTGLEMLAVSITPH